MTWTRIEKAGKSRLLATAALLALTVTVVGMVALGRRADAAAPSAPGALKYTIEIQTKPLIPREPVNATTPPCPSGEVVSGGGAELTNPPSNGVSQLFTANGPVTGANGLPNAWHARVFVLSATPGTVLKVTAICVRP